LRLRLRRLGESRLTQPGHGRARFPGHRRQDGTYYRLDPSTGASVWATNVVFGGSAGGFIGTAAYDGQRVYGATAFGDLGAPCEPNNPGHTPFQEPSAHAFGADGHIAWQANSSQSFGSTTVAGGATFVGSAVTPAVEVRDATSGALLATLPAAGPASAPSSHPATRCSSAPEGPNSPHPTASTPSPPSQGRPLHDTNHCSGRFPAQTAPR
jgi:hypothetical protein